MVMPLEENGDALQDTIDRAIAAAESGELGEAPEEEQVEVESSPEPQEETAEAAQPESEESEESEEPQDGDASPAEIEDHKALEEAAKRLGYKLDGRALFHKERHKHNKRVERQRAEHDAALQDLNQRAAALSDKFSRALEIEKAIEADNVEAIAQAMGFESWQKLNEQHIRQQISPEYKRIQALEKREQERQKQMIEQQQALEAERQERAQAEAEAEYREEISSSLEDQEEYSVWAKDPNFIDAIVSFQRARYTPEEGTISAEEAANLAKSSAYDMYAVLWDRFGGENPTAPSGGDNATSPSSGANAMSPTSRATAGNKNRKRKPTKNISQSETAGASGEVDTSEMTFEESVAFYAEIMKNGHAGDTAS